MTGQRAAVVVRTGAATPFERAPGIRTLHITTAAIGAHELLTGITEFDSGASLPMHFHNCEEAVVILEGQAAFEAEGEVHELEVGDSTFAPAGTVHRFMNRGRGVMKIFWAYGSVEATRTVIGTARTARIDEEHPESS